MNRRNLIASFIVACGLSFWAPAQAEIKLTSLLDTVTADSVVVLQIKDASQLPSRLEGSTYGALWKDEQMRAFFKPLIDKVSTELEGDQGKIAQEVLGKVKAVAGAFTGEVVASVGAVDFKAIAAKAKSGEEPSPEEVLGMIPNVVLIGKTGEGGKFAKALEELVAFAKEKVKEDAPGSIETVQEKIDGEEATIIKAINKEDGKELEVAGYAEAGGYGVLAIPRRGLEDTLKALKTGIKGESIQSGPLATFKEKSKSHDVLCHFNLQAVIKPGLDAVEEALPLPEQAQQMGISVKGIRRALGLDDLQGISVASNFEPKAATTDMAILYAKQTGLLKLLAYKNGELPEANFIPRKVDSASVALFDFGSIFGTMMQIVKDVSPALAPMITMQLGSMETQLGVSLEKDIFGNLGDKLVYATSVTQGKGPGGAMVPQQDIVYMVSMKDFKAFEVGLDKLLSQLLPQFGAEIEKGEYKGRPLNSIKLPGGGNPEAAALQPKVEYSVGKNYLTLSIGKGQVLRQMFDAAKDPGQSIWAVPSVKQAVESFPKGPCGLAYQDLAGVVHVMAKSFGDMAKNSGGDELPLDFSKLPDIEHLRKLMGTAVSASYIENNGLFTTMKEVPAGNE